MKVKLLTNSLASQDVPAVNSHYKRWRKPLVQAGVELYETRPDAAYPSADRRTRRRPTAKFVGLHVKAIVVDRRARLRRLDEPRPPLRRAQQRDGGRGRQRPPRAPARRYHGARHAAGERVACDGERTRGACDGRRTARPSPASPRRVTWQRVQDLLFMLFPRNLY